MSKWVRRLRSTYERPPAPADRSALDQLVLEHFLDGMPQRRAEAALRLLKAEYVDWNEVRVTRELDLVKALGDMGPTKEQSATLRNALVMLFELTNSMDLDPLRGRPLHEIDAVLGGLGVSRRARNTTAFLRLEASVLALPTEGLRVLRRLGAVSPSADADQAIEELALVVAAADRADFYWLLSAHAKQTCRERAPRCSECVLLGDCPTGQSRRAGRRSASRKAGRRSRKTKERQGRRG